MPTDVVMPQMGESIFEGTITKWLKQPGEKVQRDEPLFEISTDKVDAEIPAPASGTLQDIKVQAGATVQVNTVVGTIAAEGEAAAGSAACCGAQHRRNRLQEETAAAPPRPKSAQPPRGARSLPRNTGRSLDGRERWIGAPAAGRRPRVCRSGRAGTRAFQPAGAEDCERKQRRSDAGSWNRTWRPHHQGRHRVVHRQARRSVRPSPLLPHNRRRHYQSRLLPARRASRACGDGASAAGRRRYPRRDRAHVGHAQEDCRAHGDVEAHQRARARCLRGGRDPHREVAREDEGEVRAGHRQQAHLHAVLCARRGARHSQVAHHQLVGGRRQHPLPRLTSTSASPSRSTGD